MRVSGRRGRGHRWTRVPGGHRWVWFGGGPRVSGRRGRGHRWTRVPGGHRGTRLNSFSWNF